jgi:hypothetical protein
LLLFPFCAKLRSVIQHGLLGCSPRKLQNGGSGIIPPEPPTKKDGGASIVASATITATTARIFAAPATAAKNPAASDADAATAATATGDRWRDWLWGFLAVLCLSQFYFVRELVAAFALFALAFGAIAAVVVSFYMLQKSWELVVARLAAWRQGILAVSPATHSTRKPA